MSKFHLFYLPFFRYINFQHTNLYKEHVKQPVPYPSDCIRHKTLCFTGIDGIEKEILLIIKKI